LNDITKKLKDYFKSIHNNEIADNENLFEAGMLDSIEITSLIVFIEKNFNITIDPDEIIEENFNSLNSLFKLIESKK
jgi:methoxymalonate biosynthesis acyl carrier protein